MDNDFQFDSPEEEHDWKKEWIGMPEFIQVDKESKKAVIIHFETWEDVKAFGELIGREITPNTKSFFFPVKKNDTPKLYTDET